MRTKRHFKYGTGIVVPCYNEEERFQLSEFSRFFKTDNTTFFCFVDDGSTDGTKKIVADFVKNIPNELKLSSSLSIKEKQKLLDRESKLCLKLISSSLWGIGMPI